MKDGAYLYLHLIIKSPIISWRRSVLEELGHVLATKQAHYTAVHCSWSCDLIQHVTFISCIMITELDSNGCANYLLYYRPRISEGFLDNDGSWKDATESCANTQCVQMNSYLLNGNLTAEHTKGLCLSGLVSPPWWIKQESEFLWDKPQDASVR